MAITANQLNTADLIDQLKSARILANWYDNKPLASEISMIYQEVIEFSRSPLKTQDDAQFNTLKNKTISVLDQAQGLAASTQIACSAPSPPPGASDSNVVSDNAEASKIPASPDLPKMSPFQEKFWTFIATVFGMHHAQRNMRITFLVFLLVVISIIVLLALGIIL